MADGHSYEETFRHYRETDLTGYPPLPTPRDKLRDRLAVVDGVEQDVQAVSKVIEPMIRAAGPINDWNADDIARTAIRAMASRL